MKAVGLRELAAYARGETSRAEALAAAQAATRQYAKRQTTWFRNQAPDWPRLAAVDFDDHWAQLQAAIAQT
jgi:tRNA dimethylallyltransferase